MFDRESLELLNDAYQDAKRLLIENNELMYKIIDELMKKIHYMEKM